jgi:hypothetical protein
MTTWRATTRVLVGLLAVFVLGGVEADQQSASEASAGVASRAHGLAAACRPISRPDWRRRRKALSFGCNRVWLLSSYAQSWSRRCRRSILGMQRWSVFRLDLRRIAADLATPTNPAIPSARPRGSTRSSCVAWLPVGIGIAMALLCSGLLAWVATRRPVAHAMVRNTARWTVCAVRSRGATRFNKCWRCPTRTPSAVDADGGGGGRMSVGLIGPFLPSCFVRITTRCIPYLPTSFLPSILCSVAHLAVSNHHLQGMRQCCKPSRLPAGESSGPIIMGLKRPGESLDGGAGQGIATPLLTLVNLTQ